MTTTTELQDLLASVERARAELHPDLDQRFVQRVAEIEHEAGEDEQAAIAAIRAALDELVKSLPEGDSDA